MKEPSCTMTRDESSKRTQEIVQTTCDAIRQLLNDAQPDNDYTRFWYEDGSYPEWEDHMSRIMLTVARVYDRVRGDEKQRMRQKVRKII